METDDVEDVVMETRTGPVTVIEVMSDSDGDHDHDVSPETETSGPQQPNPNNRPVRTSTEDEGIAMETREGPVTIQVEDGEGNEEETSFMVPANEDRRLGQDVRPSTAASVSLVTVSGAVEDGAAPSSDEPPSYDDVLPSYEAVMAQGDEPLETWRLMGVRPTQVVMETSFGPTISTAVSARRTDLPENAPGLERQVTFVEPTVEQASSREPDQPDGPMPKFPWLLRRVDGVGLSVRTLLISLFVGLCALLLVGLLPPSFAYVDYYHTELSLFTFCADTMASKPKKTPKKTLTLGEKIEVIKRYERGGIGARTLAGQYGVGKTQIQNIVNRKREYLDDFENNAPVNKRRKLRHTGNEEINKLCWEFYCDTTSRLVTCSGPMLQEQALKFANDLGVTEFKASNGWLESFKKRHNLGLSTMVGESAGVDNTVVDDWKEKLPQIIDGYAPQDVYNMDESGLFYRATSTKTLFVKGQKCSGGKQSKERLTIMLCANMVGDKEKPLVIGKSQTPRCFKRINTKTLPVTYTNNKKAWMNSYLFTDWLKKLDKKMGRQGRKILLFMDNAPSHPAVTLRNIELKYFPPNTTSRLQPMDQGIIQTVKLKYRKQQLNKILAELAKDKTSTGIDIAKKYGLKKQKSTGVVNTKVVYGTGRYAIGPDFEFKLFPRGAHVVRLNDLAIFTSDLLEVIVNCSFQHFLRKDEVSLICFKLYRKDEVGLLHDKFDLDYEPVLYQVAYSTIKETATLYSTENFMSSRPEIEGAFLRALRDRLQGDCCTGDNTTQPAFCRPPPDCDMGYHTDVRYFQLLSVTLPTLIVERSMRALTLQIDAEKEQFIQDDRVTRKVTEAMRQSILNQAEQIRANGTARAALVLSRAYAQTNQTTEMSHVNGLQLMYNNLNISQEEEKASLHWIRALEKHPQLYRGISYQDYVGITHRTQP
uniref:HTH CENPB-type domain-containing protein n=1 Tax=Branchiostoma floridae TaxID=7739 RepID=C3ZUT4_BRAFL|eukprot:XP_002587668.1 hypothetical protein BRAFLDRAFT_126732 [Branchiostoma floridae]